MPSLDWSQCPGVESVPGKLSGAWVFRNSRMPVKLVFENLEDGMTIDEVKSILGSPNDVQSADMLGFKSTSYSYHTKTSDVKIVFLNDKVMSTEGDFK